MVTFIQGLRLWFNQWRWSSIKQTWNEEYSKVYMRSTGRLNNIGNRIGKR